MICKNTVKKFCNGNIAEIENYAEAIADTTQTWHCHHRMEIQPDGTRLSKEWMIEHDIYYNLDPCMLIFLTSKEHKKLHMEGYGFKNMKHNNFRGHKHSEESKKKISESLAKNRDTRIQHLRESHLGKTSPRKGVTLSEETRKKMSLVRKGKPSPKKGKKLVIVNGKRTFVFPEVN